MIILPQQHYHKLRKQVAQVDFNNLFAIAVIDRVVSGQIYVDAIDDPKTYYIVHRYGMSLLGGIHTNDKFNSRFFDYVINKDKSRTAVEWMQVFPGEWNSVLSWPELELNTRVNFIFDKSAYRSFRDNMINDDTIRIERMDVGLFEQMEGTVTPRYFGIRSTISIKKVLVFVCSIMMSLPLQHSHRFLPRASLNSVSSQFPHSEQKVWQKGYVLC